MDALTIFDFINKHTKKLYKIKGIKRDAKFGSKHKTYEVDFNPLEEQDKLYESFRSVIYEGAING